MSATGAERFTLFGRLAGVRFRFTPRSTLNSSNAFSLTSTTAVGRYYCDSYLASKCVVCREAKSIRNPQKSLR
jgi:hypothetical protein